MPYKSRVRPKYGERGFQDPRVVLHNIYVQLLPLNLISSHNWYI